MNAENAVLLDEAKRLYSLVFASYPIVTKKAELARLESSLLDERIWADHSLNAKLSREKTFIEKEISQIESVYADYQAITSLAKESPIEYASEISRSLRDVIVQLRAAWVRTSFSEESDILDCFIEINAGAGGTDSQDWAEMLVRMYEMWAGGSPDFNCEICDVLQGEEAGIKNATLKISGNYAYGMLKNESGVHRLVRISPFNSNGKRQTSFASVFVYPVADDSINIQILDSDLKIDTYRSSGAGGQHVNKTESAVRITHLPSGIIVACQTQRSQTQNKAEAIKMLKSKLYEIALRQKNVEKDAINAQKMEISFGSQVRNYVLHPYQIVKDLRSNWETSNASGFLDGKIQDCIESLIIMNSGNK